MYNKAAEHCDDTTKCMLNCGLEQHFRLNTEYLHEYRRSNALEYSGYKKSE